MKFIKLTRQGDVIGFNMIAVTDVHQAIEGGCIIIDVEQERFISPGTNGKWETMTKVEAIAPPHLCLQ